MRMPGWMVLSALGAVMLLPACGPGYGGGMSVGVQVQSRPGLDIYGYSANQYGDWRGNYRQWTPVVVYESNGQYYPTKFAGHGRCRSIARSPGISCRRETRLGPHDKRFNNKKRPTDADYGRARAHPND